MQGLGADHTLNFLCPVLATEMPEVMEGVAGGGTVVSTAASQRQGPGFNSWLESLSVWNLHILPVSAWVSSGCSGFFPRSKNVQVRWIDHAKFSLSVPEQECGN